MAHLLNDHDIRILVMQGKMSPDELPSVKAAKAHRDAIDAEVRAKPATEWREVNGERLPVPRWVIQAEKADPTKRFTFVRDFDRLGDPVNTWTEVAPPMTEVMKADAEWTGKKYRFDFVTRQYIQDIRPLPDWHIQRIMDQLPEGHPARPYWSEKLRRYVVRDSRPINDLQDPPNRPDLRTPAGTPWTGGDGRPYRSIMGLDEGEGNGGETA